MKLKPGVDTTGTEVSQGPSSVLQLGVSSYPVTEGESFSLYLNASSAGHCMGDDALECTWTRNGSSLCSPADQTDKRCIHFFMLYSSFRVGCELLCFLHFKKLSMQIAT